MKTPRILILSQKSPFAKVDGGVLAMRSLLEGLLEITDVRYLVLNTPKHTHGDSPIPNGLNSRFKSVFVDTSPRWTLALFNIISPLSYQLERFISPEVTAALKQEISDFQPDYILFESLFSAIYIPMAKELTTASCIFRSHNVEHKIWDDLLQQESFLPKRIYLRYLQGKLKKNEKHLMALADSVWSISKEDCDFFKNQWNISPEYVPYATTILPRATPLCTKKLFHLGAMDWQPNRQCIQLFFANIWTKIQNKQLRFYLAGKGTLDWVETLGKVPERVYTQDYIADRYAFEAEHGILVIPLISGSGVRIKAIEALAKGIPILSTPKGVEGLSIEHGKHGWIAKNDQEWISTLQDIPVIPWEDFVRNGQKHAQEHFSLQNLIKILRQLLLSQHEA